MKTNIEGVNLIKESEGFMATAYKCPAGVLTIGYGHTGTDVFEGMWIDRAGAEELLVKDIGLREVQIDPLLEVTLTPNQYSAVVSFVYNVGIGCFRRSSLLKKINADPCDKSISEEFMRYVYSGGRVLSGLVNRRKKEVELYFKK